jgi:hypothetical protein
MKFMKRVNYFDDKANDTRETPKDLQLRPKYLFKYYRIILGAQPVVLGKLRSNTLS